MAEPTKEQIDHVAPWALVLKDMLEFGADMPEGETFGQALRRFCIERGVPYPPEDIEHTLILNAAQRTLKKAPAPKGFA